jgi:uncharacterized protein (TIRG00374 family)
MVTRKNILKWAWLIGIALFVFLLYKIGPGRIWEDIKKLTWLSFLILILFRMIYWASRTLIWRIVYRSYDRQVSFLNLFSARLAGYAVSFLTPGAFFGGEAIRAMMVDTSNRKKCLASIVVDRTLEISAVIFFAVIAAVITVTRIPMSFRAKAILAVLIAFLSMFILFMLAKQRRGFFLWIIDALGKIRIRFKFLQKYMPKIQETDEYISDFYSRYRKTFFSALFLYALAHLFWVVEIYFTLVFMGVQGVTPLKAFIVVSLSVFGFMIPAIPASLGMLEITNVALFALLGLGAGTGFSMTIIRRILSLVGSGLGLVLMALKRAKR